jgi:hypothetical protein
MNWLAGLAQRTVLETQVRLAASQTRTAATFVAAHNRGSGNWLMEEAPQTVIPALLAFLDESSAVAPGHGIERVHRRLTYFRQHPVISVPLKTDVEFARPHST